MGDKETRKRKKRRESAKKEETDDSSPPREPVQDLSSKKKVEDHSSSHSLSEPSILAKIVFCVLFMLLMSAVGLIFYALNEATKSSDAMEGGAEELVKSAVLPIIDDLSSGESQPDLVSDDEEAEDSHSLPNIEDIINSIEESVTYNIDENDSDHQEINIDNLNSEEETSDTSQAEEPPVSEEIKVDQQDSLISNPSSEDLFEPSSVESEGTPIHPPTNDNPFETNDGEMKEDIQSTTNPPVEAVHNDPHTIENNPVVSDEATYLDNDNDDDDDNEFEGNDAEEEPESPFLQSQSLNVASNNIQPSSVSQANEQSEGNVVNQDAEDQESASQPEDNPEVSPQYENEDITNDYDFLFKEELDEGEKLIQKEPENGDFYFWNF